MTDAQWRVIMALVRWVLNHRGHTWITFDEQHEDILLDAFYNHED